MMSEATFYAWRSIGERLLVKAWPEGEFDLCSVDPETKREDLTTIYPDQFADLRQWAVGLGLPPVEIDRAFLDPLESKVTCGACECIVRHGRVSGGVAAIDCAGFGPDRAREEAAWFLDFHRCWQAAATEADLQRSAIELGREHPQHWRRQALVHGEVSQEEYDSEQRKRAKAGCV